MVMKVRRYADGGKVELPGPETRKISTPIKLPPPKSGPKPKKVAKKFADGGKVMAKPSSPRPKPPLVRGGHKIEPLPRAPERRASAVDIMRGKTRREQEAALGLKDGGKVKKRR